MFNLKKLLCGICLLSLTSLVIEPIQAQGATKREITQISGNLYRFQNNFHYSVFLVTDQGVIATDPINAEAAQWLKDEIKSKFDQPVKYVIYSHHHADHVSGGEVFAEDGAIVIAHENAVAALAEDNVATAPPAITFENSMTLRLGGQQVELTYLGKNHSDNSIVAYFPEQNTLFAVDFVSTQRLPYKTISRSYFPDFFQAFSQLEEMEFEILSPGHGKLGTKQDALEHGEYVIELYQLVKTAVEAGKSLDEIKQELTLEKYSDWGQFDAWREQNIEGMHGYLAN